LPFQFRRLTGVLISSKIAWQPLGATLPLKQERAVFVGGWMDAHGVLRACSAVEQG
jgi:hypothetical protein